MHTLYYRRGISVANGYKAKTSHLPNCILGIRIILTSQSDFLGCAITNPSRYRHCQLIESEVLVNKQAESDADTLIRQTALTGLLRNMIPQWRLVQTRAYLWCLLGGQLTIWTCICWSIAITLYSVYATYNSFQWLSQHLPFPHAVTGCDSTSGL